MSQKFLSNICLFLPYLEVKSLFRKFSLLNKEIKKYIRNESVWNNYNIFVDTDYKEILDIPFNLRKIQSVRITPRVLSYNEKITVLCDNTRKLILSTFYPECNQSSSNLLNCNYSNLEELEIEQYEPTLDKSFPYTMSDLILETRLKVCYFNTGIKNDFSTCLIDKIINSSMKGLTILKIHGLSTQVKLQIKDIETLKILEICGHECNIANLKNLESLTLRPDMCYGIQFDAPYVHNCDKLETVKVNHMSSYINFISTNNVKKLYITIDGFYDCEKHTNHAYFADSNIITSSLEEIIIECSDNVKLGNFNIGEINFIIKLLKYTRFAKLSKIKFVLPFISKYINNVLEQINYKEFENYKISFYNNLPECSLKCGTIKYILENYPNVSFLDKI